ncbi:MAG: hypothetical protein ACKOQ8_07855 [Micrococcales bacterium]
MNHKVHSARKRNIWSAAFLAATITAGAILVSAPAQASAWPCDNTGAGISSASGRVKGTGYWACNGIGLSGTFGAEVHIFHNYDWLPDPEIAYGQWILTKSTGTQSRSVQRCDQSTTADYYSQAQIPAYGSPWATSGLLNITTCAGTGS